LRVGLNVIGLQREIVFLGVQEQREAARVLKGVAAHYAGNPLRAADPKLCAQIDRAILPIAAMVSGTHERHHREALMMLVGIRSVLFPAAPPPFDEMQAPEMFLAAAAQ